VHDRLLLPASLHLQSKAQAGVGGLHVRRHKLGEVASVDRHLGDRVAVSHLLRACPAASYALTSSTVIGSCNTNA
jgi:hypothetical protein